MLKRPLFLMKSLAFGLLVLTSQGCVPSINIQVMKPADVAFPAHVKTLAIVDRSRPTGNGQGALALLEGAITGENPGADLRGREETIHGLTDQLRTSPRFQVVLPAYTKEEVASDMFGRPMSWEQAVALCKKAKCDAIVALEHFDSDWLVGVTSDTREYTEDGVTKKKLVYIASLDAAVHTGWRVYDVSKKTLLDEADNQSVIRDINEEGDAEGAVLGLLPDQNTLVPQMGSEAGYQYALRIAPTPILVSRSYYVKGDDLLKEAKPYVRANDWAGATTLWEQAAQSPDAKVRGRAHFNLALAAEVAGDLQGAAELVKQAAIELDNGRARDYQFVVNQRINDERRLQEQLAPVQPPTPPTETPNQVQPHGR